MNSPKIGQGIYTAADASRILKMPYSRTKYWFSYYAKQRFAAKNHVYHFQIKDSVAVNFLALIEMYVFFTLKEQGIKTRTIVKAHETMAVYLQTPYPFAMEDLFIDNSRLLFGDEHQLITADERLQTVIVQILRPFIRKIEFSNNKLAKKFYPLGKENSVVVNPEHQFGQPIIDGTNILTETIFMLSKGGDSNEFIAKLYNISVKNVEDAIRFSIAA